MSSDIASKLDEEGNVLRKTGFCYIEEEKVTKIMREKIQIF